MASRKPKGFGPVDDKLISVIERALKGSGWAKKKQAQKVIGKVRERGGINLKTGEYITKSRYPKGVKSRNYQRDFPEESALAKKLIKQGKDKRAAEAKKNAYTRSQNALAEKKANDARIIKGQSRTVNIQQLGEAAGRKGSKRKGGKEIPMTPAQVRRAEQQAARAGSQRKKGNAKLRQEQIDLKKAIDSTKDARVRTQLRRDLRAHRKLHGIFDY